MTSAIILAAGMASRMNGIDKQLVPIAGIPAIAHSVRAFSKVARIDRILVITRPERKEAIEEAIAVLGKLDVPTEVLPLGGATRQDSVTGALEALDESTKMIAIHDGARPMIRPQEIEAVLDAAEKTGAAILAAPVTDTIKKAVDGVIEETIDRSTLYGAQTPQVFALDLYRKAVLFAKEQGIAVTDDASLLEAMGHPVSLVLGASDNRKITTPDDLLFAEAVLARRAQPKGGNAMLRIGHGYDVHRLTEGRKLILGGVEIPYEKGLLGHSDADVLTHAVMDALFGALALPDIGAHFPDSDPAYKGADSIALLRETVKEIDAHGYALGNLDATVVAQAPKLMPYIPSMRECLAKALGTTVDRVNVKATTEEKLGFTGSGEGISATAVVLLEKK